MWFHNPITATSHVILQPHPPNSGWRCLPIQCRLHVIPQPHHNYFTCDSTTPSTKCRMKETLNPMQVECDSTTPSQLLHMWFYNPIHQIQDEGASQSSAGCMWFHNPIITTSHVILQLPSTKFRMKVPPNPMQVACDSTTLSQLLHMWFYNPIHQIHQKSITQFNADCMWFHSPITATSHVILQPHPKTIYCDGASQSSAGCIWFHNPIITTSHVIWQPHPPNSGWRCHPIQSRLHVVPQLHHSYFACDSATPSIKFTMKVSPDLVQVAWDSTIPSHLLHMWLYNPIHQI